jgi:hydrogenase nickel incorporation protein HypA/HybF
MHEMGIAFQLIDSLRDLCKENHVKKLISVTLTLGEASMVVPRYMSECWDAAIADSEFKETKLKIVTTIAKGRCNVCGTEFEIAKNEQKCPHCGAVNNFIPISGMEVEISEIEAE